MINRLAWFLERKALGLQIFEVPVQLAQRLPVDAPKAYGLAKEGERGHAFGYHPILIEHGKRFQDLPNGKRLLLDVKQNIRDHEARGCHIGVHSNGFKLSRGSSVCLDRNAGLLFLTEERADTQLNPSQGHPVVLTQQNRNSFPGAG